MARASQNGWSVIGPNDVDRRPIAGVTFPNGFRRGHIYTIFSYLFRRFDAEVESLVPGWCWGWHVKGIEGSSAISNHASGTAGDVNAPKHVLGKRGTFRPAQVRSIRSLLSFFEGTVRWGGDYVGRADDMHFEFIGDAGDAARIAAKIERAEHAMRDYTFREVDGRVPELRQGDVDPPGATQWVTRLQRLLGVDDDGDYGPATAAALAERMAEDPKRSSIDGRKCYVPEWRRLYALWE
jgi:hypothetical protein